MYNRRHVKENTCDFRVRPKMAFEIQYLAGLGSKWACKGNIHNLFPVVGEKECRHLCHCQVPRISRSRLPRNFNSPCIFLCGWVWVTHRSKPEGRQWFSPLALETPFRASDAIVLSPKLWCLTSVILMDRNYYGCDCRRYYCLYSPDYPYVQALSMNHQT